ncbi:MAG: galactokinase [Anaerolineales bacterium]|nr:galactokinase [Anaerolineales bacterium]
MYLPASIQVHAADAFEERYGERPFLIIRAPGRVNLIGEHTDYNDGFVLPMAIDRAVYMAIRPRTDGCVELYSLDYQELGRFELANIKHHDSGWLEYIKGTVWAMQTAGMRVCGLEGVLVGDVPLGAGLSSSAALEMATARAFTAVSNQPWNPAEMAKIGQKAENKWVGVNTGIMDQMISAAGKVDHALLIDCRSLETEAVPLPPGTTVVIMDTSTRRGLVDSAYNERREQCEAAAAFFNVSALRDLDEATFNAHAQELDDLTRRRAKHVVTENARVLKACAAMRAGDAVAFGQLMNASHASMQNDFEISNAALNTMAALARQQPGCYGARMTGGGFGGCAVALVDTDSVDDFVTAVTSAYTAATQLTPQIYVSPAQDGAAIVAE